MAGYTITQSPGKNKLSYVGDKVKIKNYSQKNILNVALTKTTT